MLIEPNDLAAARDEADRATQYLDEDGKWRLLAQWVEELEELDRAVMRADLRLEQLGYLLAPTVAKKTWKKVRDARIPLDQRIHALRLEAAALAPEPGSDAQDNLGGPFRRR